MKKILILCTLFTSMLFAAPCNPDQGNKAYQEKQYAKAIDLWRACVDQGIKNTNLYYNLGNAYYRQGKLGFAIFYYESAHRLAPGNEDISHNLKFAKKLTRDKTEETDIEENPILKTLFSAHHILSLREQLWIILILIWFILVISTFRVFQKSPRLKNICSGIVLILTSVGGITALSAGYKIYIRQTNHVGVVTASSADVISSPSTYGQVLNTLSEGTTFQVLNAQNGWVQIKLGDKIKGYVENSEIGVIK